MDLKCWEILEEDTEIEQIRKYLGIYHEIDGFNDQFTYSHLYL